MKMNRFFRTIYAFKHLYRVNRIFITVFGIKEWIKYPRILTHDLDKLLRMLWKYNKGYNATHHMKRSHHMVYIFNSSNENLVSLNNIREMACDLESGRYKNVGKDFTSMEYFTRWKKINNVWWNGMDKKIKKMITVSLKEVKAKHKYPKVK